MEWLLLTVRFSFFFPQFSFWHSILCLLLRQGGLPLFFFFFVISYIENENTSSPKPSFCWLLKVLSLFIYILVERPSSFIFFLGTPV